MLAPKKVLVGIGAAALIATGGGVTATAAQPVADTTKPTASTPGQHALGKGGYSKASRSYAYGSAKWTWKGAGKTSGIRVHINDKSCRDGYDTFAFMQFKSARNGQVITGKSRVRDYNRNCKGNGVTRTIPAFTDGFDVRYARVRVCKNDSWGSGDTCAKGDWHRNPYA
ncbi:MAG: hypothetical protein ACRDP3_28545 [Streptomyces sp.]|uniref:hypothetical protein n=1 Tax=Streptomyces sp. TaxID=1931 RepID=UPI003D6B88E8